VIEVRGGEEIGLPFAQKPKRLVFSRVAGKPWVMDVRCCRVSALRISCAGGRANADRAEEAGCGGGRIAWRLRQYG
jgi:hypothetical protein